MKSILVAVAIVVGIIAGAHAQCSTNSYTVEITQDSTVTITAPTTAQFVFVESSASNNLTIVANGGSGLSAALTTNSYNSFTFAVASYDATYDPSAADSVAVPPSAMMTVAMMATAAYVMGPAGMFLGGAANMPVGVAAADCKEARLTIYIPNSRSVRFNLVNANVVSPVCPSGAVYQTGSGCAYWQSTYTRVWSAPANSAGCAAAIGTTVTATSTAGNSFSFSDSQPTQVWTYTYGDLAALVTNYPIGTEMANITIFRPYYEPFAAVSFVTPTLSCSFAYACTSGNCTTYNDLSPTYNCGSYLYTPSGVNISASCNPHVQQWTGYPYGPAVQCNAWCNQRTASATCTMAQCPTGSCNPVGAPCPNTFNGAAAVKPAYATVAVIAAAILAFIVA